jgi:uncharacterized membrane protein YkoI
VQEVRGSFRLAAMKYYLPFVAGLLWVLLGLSSPSYAQRAEQQISLSAAVSMVQQRFNATAVKTDTVQEGDQLLYRIRLLSADKSRVWTITVDARTGRIY